MKHYYIIPTFIMRTLRTNHYPDTVVHIIRRIISKTSSITIILHIAMIIIRVYIVRPHLESSSYSHLHTSRILIGHEGLAI